LNGHFHNFFRTAHGKIIELPDATPSGSASVTYLIHNNNQDVVVGMTAGDFTFSTAHGCLLREGHYTLFDFPGATATAGLGINDQNEVVGWYLNNGVAHGFLKQGDDYTTIDFPGAKGTNLMGINNRGQIVGGYVDASDIQHGFLLSDGIYTTIDFPDSTKPGNSLWSINDLGEAVGSYNYGNGAFSVTIAPPKGGKH
jgi:probable HAF family extracellular repeat protein